MRHYARVLCCFIAFFFIECCLIGYFIAGHVSEKKARNAQTLNQKMYCVELLADGTTIPMGCFTLDGEMFNNEEGKRCIRLQPFTISSMTFSTIYYHDALPRLNDTYKNYYHVRICMAENAQVTDLGAYFSLSHELQYCKIESYGRCFIASMHEEFDPNLVSTYFEMNR